MNYNINDLEYAGFWKRFCALWLDAIILIPYIALNLWLLNHYRLYNIYSIFIGNIIAIYLHVYLVRMYGGSPGKLLMGIRIIRHDGYPVTYREAVLRYIVDFILSLVGAIGTIYAVLHITDAQYLALNHRDKFKLIKESTPLWSYYVHILSEIWIWSEFIVMLLNDRRRALHDYIAGTVVIVVPKKPSS